MRAPVLAILAVLAGCAGPDKAPPSPMASTPPRGAGDAILTGLPTAVDVLLLLARIPGL